MSGSPSPGRLAQVKRLFQEALDLRANQRLAFLAKACAGDDALRLEVIELLLLHRERDTFLDEPIDASPAFRDLAAPRDGHVGPYRLVRELGRGGMGVVHLAERDGQLVALKLIGTGGLLPELRERFRLEAEILQRLEHPGLSRLLDAGEATLFTGLHQPWIAMEYIDGQSLREHADRARFTIEARVRLVLAVCEAVQHAHAHGVIHRDLKPGNILVRADGRPVVLDFGVARLVTGEERPTEFGTRTGQLLGTPQYMSPEQVRAEPSGVGPESDVYSLGVILYELLCGKVPYDATTISLHRAVVTILFTDPAPLSQQDPVLRGPLERIVMKALEKEPRHRYRDAGALADDLRRFLDGRTVHATGPGLVRRTQGWARQHRRLATTLTVAAVLGAFAVVWAVAGGRRIPRERVLSTYRQVEELVVGTVPIVYERERTPASMRDAIERLTRARTLLESVPPLSHRDFLLRLIEKDLGTAQLVLGDLLWDVGLAREACLSLGRARSIPQHEGGAQFRDKQVNELAPHPIPDSDLTGLLAGANLLCHRLWGEPATLQWSGELTKQAYEESVRRAALPADSLGPSAAGLIDRVAHAWNARAEVTTVSAWFYRDAAVARQAVAWSDSAASRWTSFGDNWPALGSVLFERARALHALGVLTRDVGPLDQAAAALRACEDYRGPGRPLVFAQTREQRAALALDRAALELDPARATLLLRAALHDLDTARVVLTSANAIPAQRAAPRSTEAEVFTALARVTRSPALLDSARSRLVESGAAFPHTGFPREASLHWLRQGLLEVARMDVSGDHTALAAARGAFEHARSLARNRKDQGVLARVDEAERQLGAVAPTLSRN